MVILHRSELGAPIWVRVPRAALISNFFEIELFAFVVGTVFALCVLEHGNCWSQCGAGLKILMSTGCRAIFYAQSNLLCIVITTTISGSVLSSNAMLFLLHKPSIILCDRFGFADDTNVIKWEQLDYTRTTCGDSFALCTRGAKAKTKLGAKRRYNHWILQRLCVSSSRTVHALNLTKSRMTAIAELFIAWMQIPSFKFCIAIFYRTWRTRWLTNVCVSTST